MQKDVELRSWDGDPSMEVLNGSMFLNHFARLEWIQWLGLKTYTLTLVVMWIALIRVWTILSTCALSHAVPVTISFELIVWSGFKLSRERLSHDFSWALMTRSCPMTTGLKGNGIWLINNF